MSLERRPHRYDNSEADTLDSNTLFIGYIELYSLEMLIVDHGKYLLIVSTNIHVYTMITSNKFL